MRVVSVFSGAGGLDLGFIEAGHSIVWANDIDNDAVATYNANISKKIVHGAIEDISSDVIPKCDIVIGGFPCQGFSMANIKRNTRDTRNELYLQLLRVIRDKKPKYFLAENVKGLASLDKGQVLKLIINDFERAGYRVNYKVLNAVNYGVPQFRERIIIIGIRNDLRGARIKFPEATHADPASVQVPLKKWVSIGEALASIPEPEEAPDIPNHTYSRYKLRFNGYLGHRFIDPARPAPTVTARGDRRGGVVVLHHPKNHRRMSARELAVAQGFPMNFVFSGSRSNVYRLIANAVPPPFAKALASMFPPNGK